MNKKLQIAATLMLLLISQLSFSQAVKESERHIFRWSKYDGTPNDPNGYRNLIYEIDGKSYSLKNMSVFCIPELNIRGNSIVDVYFPREAKVNHPEFAVPLQGNGIIQEWVKAGVTIVYHYRGHILPRHILICRERYPSHDADCSEVMLDGKKLGKGKEAFKKLKLLKWESPSFLTIRFVHEYPNYPSGPVDQIYGDGLIDWLEQQNVKLEYSHEFTDDKDPWDKKK